MYPTTTIPTTSPWVSANVREVRDALLSLQGRQLERDRERLVTLLSQAVGALDYLDEQSPAPARRLDDGLPGDWEETAWPEERWAVTVDADLDEVLAALELPALAGGAPFEPEPRDWAEYESMFLDRLDGLDDAEFTGGPLSEADVITATGAY